MPDSFDPSANLFLIGYRGSGKSTVAEILAQALGRQWTDADALLEARQGRTIAEIFVEDGEAGFRRMEDELLEELCRRKQHIVATGGGAILRAANRDRLRAAGVCIWLTADPQTIADRLEADPTTKIRRPNLALGGLAEIEDLLKMREPLYRACAHWTIDTVKRTPNQVAEIILERLDGCECRSVEP
jgi:shikimate kinase